MNTQMAVGYTMGLLWAKSSGVSSSATRNRAGLLLAAGGMTPTGLVLASSVIRRALESQRQSTSTDSVPALPDASATPAVALGRAGKQPAVEAQKALTESAAKASTDQAEEPAKQGASPGEEASSGGAKH